MGLFKPTDWAEIAKDASLDFSKRKKAVEKIKDPAQLLEIASCLSKAESIHDGLLNLVFYRLLPLVTLNDIIQYDLGLLIPPDMVWRITNQEVLCWLAENGSTSHLMGAPGGQSKDVRELAFERIADPSKKAILGPKVQASKENREREQTAYIEREREEIAMRRKEWKEKRLCPKCGGRCKYEIQTQPIDPNLPTLMLYEARNLQPVEMGKCLKCGHSFISKGPQEIQKMWSSRNEQYDLNSDDTKEHSCNTFSEHLEPLDGCRKKCSYCGAIYYDHDYELIKAWDVDAPNYETGGIYTESYEKYKCSKCGHIYTKPGGSPQVGRIKE